MEKVKSILTVYRNDEIFSKQFVFHFCFSALKQIQTHLRNSQGQEKYIFFYFLFLNLSFLLIRKKEWKHWLQILQCKLDFCNEVTNYFLGDSSMHSEVYKVNDVCSLINDFTCWSTTTIQLMLQYFVNLKWLLFFWVL